MQRPNQPSRSLLFPAAPNVDCYSAVGSVEAARSRLVEVIRGAEGVGLLVGPAGTGKSLLCCLLTESLKDDFHVVLLADSQLTTGETLLKHILFHLNMPYRDLSEGELRLSLIDQLTQGMRGSTKSALALIIDEAQTLSTRLLEEIRMITNIVRDGQPRVRTILAGGPELEDRLSDPKLESLNQRIASRCYLHPLTLGETARYVRDAAMCSGVHPGFLIDDDAVRVVHQATGGIPRLVNQLMRHVIAASPTETIRAEHVNWAWQSLQQLPSPLTDAETNALVPPASGEVLPKIDIVEFGTLTEGPAASVSQADQTPGDQHHVSEPDEARSAESIDPIAKADPSLAADLERVTESLQRMAADDPDDVWCEADDEGARGEAWSDHDSTEAVESSDTDAVNLQFDCHAGDADTDLPANYHEAFSSEDLTMEWDSDVPEAAHFEATTGLELCDVQPQDGDMLASDAVRDGAPADHEGRTGRASSGNDAPVIIGSSAASPQEPVLPLEELFGTGFDEEEPITTERNYGTSFAPSLSIGTEAEAVCDTELEEEVHDQIVGMIGASMDGPETLGFPSPSAPAGEIRIHDDIQLSDDSDLLVVEESVEIEPVRIQPPMFDDDPSDSSDYQALLNRMREG